MDALRVKTAALNHSATLPGFKRSVADGKMSYERMVPPPIREAS